VSRDDDIGGAQRLLAAHLLHCGVHAQIPPAVLIGAALKQVPGNEHRAGRGSRHLDADVLSRVARTGNDGHLCGGEGDAIRANGEPGRTPPSHESDQTYYAP